MNKIPATLGLLCISFCLSAQINFTTLNGPPGGRVLDLETNSSGSVIYALVSENDDEYGTVYVSDNGGSFWEVPKFFYVNADVAQGLTDTFIDIEVGADNKCYALGKNTIFQSNTSGNFWTHTTAISPTFTAQTFASGNKLQVAANGTLYVKLTSTIIGSTNQGANWSVAATAFGKTINDITVDGSTVYLATDGSAGASMYTFSGFNANSIGTIVSSGLPSEGKSAALTTGASGKIYLVMLTRAGSPANSEGIYELNSTTWSKVCNETDVNFDFDDLTGKYRLFTSQSNASQIFIQHNTSIYSKNPPSPGSWTQVPITDINDNINAFLAYSTDYYIGYSGSGLMHSDDAGSNWNYTDYGISNAPTVDFVKADNGNLVATTGKGILLVSNNGGANWQRRTASVNANLSVLHKLTNGTVLALGTDVYKSTDNGLTWSFVESAPANKRFSAVSGGDNSLFAVCYDVSDNSEYQIFTSTSGNGSSWSATAFTGLPAPGTYAVRQIAANNGYLYLLTYATTPDADPVVYKIQGGAASVFTIPNTNKIRYIRTSGDNIYAVADNNSGKSFLAVTADPGGGGWTNKEITNDAFKTSNTYYIYNENIIFANLAFAANYNSNFYATTDGGDSWTTAFTGYNHQVMKKVDVDADGIALVIRSNGPMAKSLKSVFKPDAPSNVRAIATGDSTVFIQWDQTGEDVVEFRLERKKVIDAEFVTVAIDSAEDNINSVEDEGISAKRYFSDYSVEAGTNYVYRVMAKNLAGTTRSGNVAVTTKTSCIGDIPDNRSWTGVITSGPTYAQISIRKTGNDLYYISDVTAGVVAGLTGQTEIASSFYQNCTQPFVERGKDKVIPNGNGSWDGTTLVLNWQLDVEHKPAYPATAKTITLTLNANDPTPDVPDAPYVYASGTSQITVGWTAGKYQDTYKIERAFTIGGPYNEVGTVSFPETTFPDPGSALDGISYFYRIKAFNSNASPLSSAFSAPVSITFHKPNFVLSNTLVSRTSSSALSSTWSDLDSDGDEDLIMAELAPPNTAVSRVPLFFKNNGLGDFTSVASPVPSGSYVGASAGDYDNDGKPDLYFPFGVGGESPKLFGAPVLLKNNGNFSFLNVNSMAPAFQVNAAPSLSNWVDYDKDGYLDLFVSYGEGKQKLFHGSATGFTQVSGNGLFPSGMHVKSAVWGDYDQDNLLDVFITASNTGNLNESHIFHNEGGGAFLMVENSDIGPDSFSKKFQNTSWVDYDNDGDLDLFATVSQGANMLYVNSGGGGGYTFSRATEIAGSPTESKTEYSFTSNWGDFDNDGDLDVIVIHILAPATLYINLGSGTFAKAGKELINTYQPLYSIASATADYDNDGFLDLVIGETVRLQDADGPAPLRKIKLLKNNNNQGSWVKVKLEGKVSNRSGIGAKIFINPDGAKQFREVTSTTGLGTYNSQVAHFGVGSQTTVNIRVQWPFGLIQNLINVPVNKTYTVVEETDSPVISSTNPVNNAVGVDLNTSIEITFDEPPFGVAGKNVSLFKIVGLSETPVKTFSATSGTVVGNKVSFTLSSALEVQTEYKVKVDNGAFKDIYGNAFTSPNFSWTFTSRDNSFPELSYTAIESPGVGFQTLTLPVTATDNVAVSDVTLYYRKVGETDFSTLTGDPDADNTNNNRWNFAVKESFFSAQGMEFYVTVTDPSHNTTRAPVAENEYYQVNYETVPPVIAAHTPHDAVGKGFSTYALSVTASDNKSVSAVKISYRAVGDTDFTVVSGTFLTNAWNFTIQESFFSDDGMEYFISAQDASGNTARLPEADDTYFKTTYETEPPVITAGTFPALLEKGFVSQTYTVDVTDNKGIATVTMELRNTKDGDAYTSTEGDLTTGSTYQFTIAESEFNGDGIEFYFTATDPTGNVSTSPSGGDPEQLTNKTLLDNVAPVVTFNPANFLKLPKNFTDHTYIASVTEANTLTSVVLKHRQISGSDFSTIAGEETTSGTWNFKVLKDHFDLSGMEFYLEATDKSGNTGRAPLDDDEFFSTALEYDIGDAQLVIPKGSADVSGYKIISVPFDLANNSIAENFEELGNEGATQFRFLRYAEGPPKRWDEYPGGNLTVLKRGEGYFINSKTSQTISLTKATAPVNTQNDPFQLTLLKGWNQIGNPYTSEITWKDALEYNTAVTGVGNLFTYSGTGYAEQPIGLIQPFTGGFVHADADVTVSIPISAGGRKRSTNDQIPTDLSAEWWQMPLTVTQGEIVNNFTAVGMHPDASLSKDDFDAVPPPKFTDYLEMNTRHPEYFEQKLSRDVVPTQNDYTWEFEIDSNLKGNAVISWDNTAFGDNVKQLFLLDEEAQVLIDMRKSQTYEFKPPETRKIRIYFGENLDGRINPSFLNLGKAFPNPTSGLTTIGFTLPLLSDSYKVSLEVYNVMGRKVATLVNGIFAPGFYNAEWDATHETLSNGFYTYRLVVDGGKTREIRSGKLILSK
jgi:hypothetical protein